MMKNVLEDETKDEKEQWRNVNIHPRKNLVARFSRAPFVQATRWGHRHHRMKTKLRFKHKSD